MTTAPWRDPALPAAARVDDLLSRMTLEEKTAQLYGVWVGATATDGGEVAPLQREMTADYDWDELITHGLGQLTRPFGTAPVDPALGAQALARAQRRIAGAWPASASPRSPTRSAWPVSRPGRPPPTPSRWPGARPSTPSWSRRWPAASARTSARSASTRASPRSWTSYGICAGAGWRRPSARTRIWSARSAPPTSAASNRPGSSPRSSTSPGTPPRPAARNQAPVRAGIREFADVTLPPFELALREGGARSVMAAYNDTDGVPAHADTGLLTELLREQWGFTGTVVADYFGIGFLQTLHRVAETEAEAAHAALAAGVDVELPTLKCYGTPLLEAVGAGSVPESLIDRAARRVLLQKCELGLLDEDWDPELPGGSPSTRRRTAPWPAVWPRSRWSCWTTRTACCRWPRTPASRWSAREPTTPWRCSAATPSRPTSSRTTPRCRWASRSPPCWSRCGPNSRTPRSRSRRAAGSRTRTPRASRRRWPGRPRRTSAWPCSATGRACSAGAPRARAATRRTCTSPAPRASCWTHWWRRASRWS